MTTRPIRANRQERLHELLGAYDLMNRITLYGPHYSNSPQADAVLIHERSHSIIGNVTTYGTFQKALAFLFELAERQNHAALAARIEEGLNQILDGAFNADEGFAMARERDLSLLRGRSFDPASMPDDYAEALSRYDRLISAATSTSAGERLLMLHGLAEAVFNTAILRRVHPSALLDDSANLFGQITSVKSPDERLGVLEEMFMSTSVPLEIESRIKQTTSGRIVVDDAQATIDEAILAAFEVPGVRSDQQLRLAYLAASMATFEVLHESRPEIFDVGPQDAIAENLPYLDALRKECEPHGISLPLFKGVRSKQEEQLAEGVLYAPQDREFDVAWALPDLVARLAGQASIFFFNSPSPMGTEPPTDLPEIHEMLFLTPFALRPAGEEADGAHWQVQLMVPIVKPDEPTSEAIYRHIIDDVVLIDGDDICLDQFAAIESAKEDSIVAILTNTDLPTVEAALRRWQAVSLFQSARLVTTFGPLHYYQVRLHERPRVILRVPSQVVTAMSAATSALLPRRPEPWDQIHLRWLEQTLCHLIEAGAFFGSRRVWHNEFVDDLMIAGIDHGFQSFSLGAL